MIDIKCEQPKDKRIIDLLSNEEINKIRFYHSGKISQVSESSEVKSIFDNLKEYVKVKFTITALDNIISECAFKLTKIDIYCTKKGIFYYCNNQLKFSLFASTNEDIDFSFIFYNYKDSTYELLKRLDDVYKDADMCIFDKEKVINHYINSIKQYRKECCDLQIERKMHEINVKKEEIESLIETMKTL